MLRLLNNRNGIALVTSLMLTLITMTIIAYLLSIVTQGLKVSAASQRYKSALAASYGAVDLVTKELLPTILSTTLAAGLATPASATVGLYASSLNFHTTTDPCLMEKLTTPSALWTCTDSTAVDPRKAPDFQFTFNSTDQTNPFNVYVKIVETQCSDHRPYPTGRCTGSDLSGVDYLDGGQGTTGGAAGISVQSMPAMYRLDIRSERASNPLEKSVVSVLYAY